MTNPGLPTITPPFTLPELGKLAREMAMDIREKAAILHDYNLDDEQYAVLCNTPTYAKLLSAFVQEWNSVASVQDRIKFQSAYALEDGLPGLSARMANSNEPLSGAVETGKLLARLAGVGEGAAGVRTGEKFTINISLGNQKLSFENETRPIRPLPEGESEAPTLLDFDKRETSDTTARSEPESEEQSIEIRTITETTGEGISVEPLTEKYGSKDTIQTEEDQ